MNTKIRTSFGLVLLLAIGIIATMVALGMFTAKPASAALDGTLTVTPSPTKARSIAQYTIVVTGGGTQNALAVGESIIVTFNTSTGVPSSIASSAVKVKSTILTGGGTAGQLVNSSAVTVSGKAVTIIVPDMDPTAGNGDQGIGANSAITITFTQAAGIQNPNTAKEAGDTPTNGYTLTLSTTTDTTAQTSAKYDITRFVSYSPSTGAARGATVTVSGGGFTKNCTTCNIRFNPQTVVTPTTGNEGTGSIDADGVFSGTFVVDASTNKVSWFVWVVDSTGTGKAASTAWVQKAGATPRSTTVSAGSTVTVDLIDYTVIANNKVTENNATTGTDISGNAVLHATAGDFDLAAGKADGLSPYKFKVPNGLATGSHVVTVRESLGGTKSATFTLEVVSHVLTVVPATAVPGQQITISGSGFDKTSGTIPINSLTATANSTTVILNPSAAITVTNVGKFTFQVTVPTANAFAGGTSNTISIVATDNNGVKGTSTGFSRTPRTLTLSPSTASPGESVTVTVTGMTADNNESGNTFTAKFTVTGMTFPANATFPVNSDGAGTGSVTIPLGTQPGTTLLTATDNADSLNGNGDANRSATANVVVPAGTVGVDPIEASTGNFVTVSGSGFPPNATGTSLKFGAASGFPSGGFTTDGDGGFSVLVEVPGANTGGSITPGSLTITVTIGQIDGDTTFTIPQPSITLTPSEAMVEDTIVITGTGFNSLVTATKLEIGSASAMPSPAPRVGRNGEITATVLVPLLNPGTYVVVLETGAGFSATGTFKAIAPGTSPASSASDTQDVFAVVIANGDNLVRVWRFSNTSQTWDFYDPRSAFELANTLLRTGPGDILWVNVNTTQDFAHAQGTSLVSGWNLIVLK